MSAIFIIASVFVSAGTGIFLDKNRVVSNVWLFCAFVFIVITFWDYGMLWGLLYTFAMFVIARIAYQGAGKRIISK